ncbi:hypothetical protein Syun_026258 [Stephania yunnanensis]|uniref:Uncharacterized protein n=1 Tax=Stephania yunnanensis TaxID=152371 RepID=A0AAP0EYP1_9MAGN
MIRIWASSRDQIKDIESHLGRNGGFWKARFDNWLYQSRTLFLDSHGHNSQVLVPPRVL